MDFESVQSCLENRNNKVTAKSTSCLFQNGNCMGELTVTKLVLRNLSVAINPLNKNEYETVRIIIIEGHLAVV